MDRNAEQQAQHGLAFLKWWETEAWPVIRQTMSLTGLTRTDALLLLHLHNLARIAMVLDRMDQHLEENAELADMQRQIARKMIQEMDNEPWKRDES